MKYFLSLLLFSVAYGGLAQSPTPVPARLRWTAICYHGPMGSPVSTSATSGEPDTIVPTANYSLTDRTPGKEIEVRWLFTRQKGDKDFYRFAVIQNVVATDPTSKTFVKEIEFTGQRLVVYEDKLHCIVMEPLAEKNSKPTVSH